MVILTDSEHRSHPLNPDFRRAQDVLRSLRRFKYNPDGIKKSFTYFAYGFRVKDFLCRDETNTVIYTVEICGLSESFDVEI